MGRKHKNLSIRYEDNKYKGKKPRKSWRRRRRERFEDRKATERLFNYWIFRRSAIAWLLISIFSKKVRRSEALREYRLRVMNLELFLCILILLILVFFLLSI